MLRELLDMYLEMMMGVGIMFLGILTLVALVAVGFGIAYAVAWLAGWA